MSTVLEIYIFVSIMLLLFNIAFLLTKNIKNQKFYAKNNKLEEQTRQELSMYNATQGLSPSYQALLLNKIGKVKHLITLQNTLDSLDYPNKQFLLDIRSVVLQQMAQYQKKPDDEQAYYTYVVSQFDYQESSVDPVFARRFLTFLETKSLYTFTNTMNALYQFGEPYLILHAIKKIEERQGFYHKKLFIDGLLDYTGNPETLHHLLIEHFHEYTPATQESLLDYFRLKGVTACQIGLDIIENPTTPEQVLYSAMRYFTKYPHGKSTQFFKEVLLDPQAIWVKELLALQGVRSYPDLDIKEIVKGKVASPNWYVRKNAISHLHHHGATKFDLYSIIILNDRYANEALLYEYREDNEITTYINKIINAQKEPAIQTISTEKEFAVAQ